MKLISILFIFAMVVATIAHADLVAPGKIEFKQVPAKVKNVSIVVELARSDSERQLGLMHRTKMGENNGMLFVFDEEAPRSFWMMNTLIPLSIAYMNSKFEILDIQDMDPMPKSASAKIPTYPSRKAAMYALEMNRGWFKKHNIHACDGVKIQACQRLEVVLPK